MEVCGKVSYSSQQSWIFSGTLRENVLFGLPFRKEWYQTVIKACALDKVRQSLSHVTTFITTHVDTHTDSSIDHTPV